MVASLIRGIPFLIVIGRIMLIIYSETLNKRRALILQKKGWKLKLPRKKIYREMYFAESASKRFEKPSDAMFEIESIFDVDVIQDTDHDGAPIHTFVWKKPKKDLAPDENRFEIAMGWMCAKFMYDAPSTPREAAKQLQFLMLKQL